MKKMKIVKQQQYYDSNEELMQIQKKKIALQIDIMQQYQSGKTTATAKGNSTVHIFAQTTKP